MKLFKMWSRWVKLFQGLPKRKEKVQMLTAELDMLTQVRQAHMEWVCALERLNYAADNDQIDYAVYAMEAAEKRYTMLLKQAKAMKLKAHQAAVPDTYYTLRITG